LDVDNPAAEILESMLLDSDDEMDLESEHDSDDDEMDHESEDDSDGRDSGYSSMASEDEPEVQTMIIKDDPPFCSTPNNSPIMINSSSDEEDSCENQTPMRQHAVSPFPSFALESPGPFDDHLFSAATNLKIKKRIRRTSTPFTKPKAARRLNFSDTI
jgi:hypothetical protein